MRGSGFVVGPVGKTQRVRFGILYYCAFGIIQKSSVGIVVVSRQNLVTFVKHTYLPWLTISKSPLKK